LGFRHYLPQSEVILKITCFPYYHNIALLGIAPGEKTSQVQAALQVFKKLVQEIIFSQIEKKMRAAGAILSRGEIPARKSARPGADIKNIQ
jgi:hypothetical protein